MEQTGIEILVKVIQVSANGSEAKVAVVSNPPTLPDHAKAYILTRVAIDLARSGVMAAASDWRKQTEAKMQVDNIINQMEAQFADESGDGPFGDEGPSLSPDG